MNTHTNTLTKTLKNLIISACESFPEIILSTKGSRKKNKVLFLVATLSKGFIFKASKKVLFP